MDILDGIATMQGAFRDNGINPPTVILFDSHRDGVHFLSTVRQSKFWTTTLGSPDLGHPVEMPDGLVYMELKVLNLSVRWPAVRVMLPGGRSGHY